MAAELPVPVLTNLADVYWNLGTTLDHAVRWDHLAQEFRVRFGRKPSYITRAPGRVNLIGEHVDYALFGCFPAAIERDILIACAPRMLASSPPCTPSSSLAQPVTQLYDIPGSVVAENIDDKYTREVFAPLIKSNNVDYTTSGNCVQNEWELDIDTKQLRWESYIKAGYYGVLNRYFSLASRSAVDKAPACVDMLVTGSVPAGSGLSSSAAMVVASTLAFLAVNGKLDSPGEMTKGKLVEMTMENEKRVGVNSGGMDQAASLISIANSALYVSFFPRLSALPVPLPGSSSPRDPTKLDPLRAVFICANSLVISDKVVHARTRYNLRVVETLVAARLLARKLNIQVGEREKVTLREVLGRAVGEDIEKAEDMDLMKLKQGLERMVKDVEILKPDSSEGGEEGVTLEKMIELSGLSEPVFKEVYLSWVDVEASRFQLYKRAKHVFTEALRVLQFREVCSQSSSSPSQSALEKLGQLMNESQESCANLFDCSCPELNELVKLSREAGAYGSRLTGAGWGGCTVSLVSETQVDSFIARIRGTYGPYKELEDERLREVVFATKPSSGACVFKFED